MDGKEVTRELRMMGLVPYNISPIQQAIQFGHAVVEYGLENFQSEEYQDWAKNWKTFIILNGGTTNDRMVTYFYDNGKDPLQEYQGSLNRHHGELLKNNISIASFREPDLGDQLTAVVFIVDERVFNRKLYPDYETVVAEYTRAGGGDHVPTYDSWLESFSSSEAERNKILFLREFLKNFRLA
jgi:hypothetical protein